MNQIKKHIDVRLKFPNPKIISALNVTEINGIKVKCFYLSILPDGNSTTQESWFNIEDLEPIPYGK